MDGDPLRVLTTALTAASACTDSYRVAAASAWPLRALIERGLGDRAMSEFARLTTSLIHVTPLASRSEAAFLLFQAAFPLGPEVRERLARELLRDHAAHWRSRRNLVDGLSMLAATDPDRAQALLRAVPDPKLRRRAAKALSSPLRPRKFF